MVSSEADTYYGAKMKCQVTVHSTFPAAAPWAQAGVLTEGPWIKRCIPSTSQLTNAGKQSRCI